MEYRSKDRKIIFKYGGGSMLNVVVCDDDTEFCNKVTKQLKKKFQADIEIKEFHKYDGSFKEPYVLG